MNFYKLYQGDCFGVMSNFDDNELDLGLTDPPYGIGINKMNFVTSGAIKAGVAHRNDFRNHSTDWDEFTFKVEYFNELKRITKNQIIFGANHFSNILPNSRGWVVWDKRCEEKYSNDFADCEIIWTSFDRPSRIIRYLWSGMLQEDMSKKEKRYHPTQKPVKVIESLLDMCKDIKTVIDPFMGSGSTMLACQNRRLDCVGVEIDPKYCNTIKERAFGRQFLDRQVEYDFVPQASVNTKQKRTLK